MDFHAVKLFSDCECEDCRFFMIWLNALDRNLKLLKRGYDFRARYNKFALFASLAVVLGCPAALRAQLFPAEATLEPQAKSGIADEPSADEIIARMAENNRLRSERLLGYSAIRRYEIQNSDGRVSAQALVQEVYRAPGSKSFSKISEQGSVVVRHMVFDRLLQSEEASSLDQQRGDGAISTANYRFSLLGTAEVGGRRCYQFRVSPIRIDRYSFEGTIWVDAEDFGIARIEGRPARKPSFWIKHAEFLRLYQRIDGFWLPWRDETTVDVKANGTKLFRIEHQEYKIQVAATPTEPAQMGLNAGN